MHFISCGFLYDCMLILLLMLLLLMLMLMLAMMMLLLLVAFIVAPSAHVAGDVAVVAADPTYVAFAVVVVVVVDVDVYVAITHHISCKITVIGIRSLLP